jgi:hypothetical protein
MNFYKIIISLSFITFFSSFQAIAQEIEDNGNLMNQSLGLWTQHINVLTPSVTEGQLVINLNSIPLGAFREWHICANNGNTPCSPTGEPSLIPEAASTSFASGRLHISLRNNRDAQNNVVQQQLIITGEQSGVPLTNEVFTVNLEIRKDQSATPKKITREYRIVCRKPMQMIFALDRSGSMEYCEGDGTAPNCNTAFVNNISRWHKLKSAVTRFVNKMNSSPTTGPFILGSDKFKVIYFSGIVNSATGGVGPFRDIGNFATTIENSMLGQENGSPLAIDGTSYGAAILKALNTSDGYDGTDAKKIFILFTDGEQNVSPKVQLAGLKLDDASRTNFRNSGIQIFTIGIGVNAALETTTILSQMPANGGGFCTPVLPTDELITTMGNQMFTSIFQNSSPQQIASERLALGSTPTSRTFPVNKDVTRLYLEAVFDKPIGDSYSYRVEHDGVEVTSKARVTKDNFFATLLIDFQNDSLRLKSEGKWTLTAIPRSESTGQGAFVRLSATADEHTLKFKCDAGQKYFKECDLITPSVRLTEAGKAIPNATVTATIYEPGKDIGDLLARNHAPNIPPVSTSLDAGSCALQKYNALKISDPALIQSYENYQPTTITLTYVGNGLYTASGYKTKVTGVYKMVYKADATTTKLGEIQRMEEQTINVRFPSLSYDVGRTKPVISPPNDNLYKFEVTVEPSYKDCSGATRLVGLGWENSYMVKGNKIFGAKVEDNCDGKYTIRFFSKAKNPVTHITLVDEPIYDGLIHDFDKPYTPQKWEVKLIVAATYPLNSLGALYKTDLFGKIGLNRRYNYRFALGVEAGHYRFRDNFAITGGTFGGDVVVFNTSNGGTPIDVSLGVGVGIFKPHNLNVEFGGTTRLIAAFELNPRLHVLAEGAYYKLATSGYDFLTVGAGLRYKF